MIKHGSILIGIPPCVQTQMPLSYSLTLYEKIVRPARLFALIANLKLRE